ncbi:helix-turn-helix domain-containing protein [Microvirga sp. TS319]|uniref:helix-turn-helix domain-containing protein n=1 Tax=Microvirga sp. TS319 TaxID=3241165 RepID=UPI00351A995A
MMAVPFPNPTTLEQMQANRRALNATFFSVRPRMKNRLPDAPALGEPEPDQEDFEELRRPVISEQEAKILDAVATRAEIPLEEMLANLSKVAALARQVAVVVLVRSLTSEPTRAATICGLTFGAAGRALQEFDPVVSAGAMPIVNDPLACIAPLWSHAALNLQDRRTATLVECLSAASRASMVPVHDMKTERRTQSLVRARQIAMWLATEFTLMSLPSIGRSLGGRDHTTILHGSRVVAKVAATITPGEDWGLQQWADALWAADWGACKGKGARA